MNVTHLLQCLIRSFRSWLTPVARAGGRGRLACAVSRSPRARRGLSLLEVMLAIAIFGGSVVTIGELIRIGTLSAAEARDLTTAQILCESKINELLTGGAELTAITGQTFDPTLVPGSQGWTYSIETGATETEGLLMVRVTVQQDQNRNNPVSFSLTAWMMDPQVEFPEPEEDSSGATGGTTGGATGGATTGGGS